jgi:hypothetical protein
MKKTPLNELSEIIVSAIEQEHFFTKEVLIPKIRAILKGFRVDLSTTKYNKLETPSDAARRLRTLEQRDLERAFWKDKVKNLVGSKIDGYYYELEELLSSKGFLENKTV